jgi:hypothetical protein
LVLGPNCRFWILRFGLKPRPIFRTGTQIRNQGLNIKNINKLDPEASSQFYLFVEREPIFIIHYYFQKIKVTRIGDRGVGGGGGMVGQIFRTGTGTGIVVFFFQELDRDLGNGSGSSSATGQSHSFMTRYLVL